MKFSMSTAWNEAVAMFTANREVLLIVAGIFFFLPNLVVFVAVPGLRDMQQQMLLNPEAGQAQMEAAMLNYWPAIVAGGFVFMLFLLTGYLALLHLLRERSRPTVAEAIRFGAFGSLPALGASLLAYIGTVIVIAIPAALISIVLGAVMAGLGIGGEGGAGGVLVGLLVVSGCLAAIFYIMTRLSLFLAVMGLEPTYRPVHAIRQSWRLTKGNTSRVFTFYALLFIVYFVIAIAISMPLALLASLGTVGLFINAVISGALSAAVAALYTTILAAVHRQLSHPAPADFIE